MTRFGIFIILSLSIMAVNSLDIRGKWREDQYKREGLSDFLSTMGKIMTYVLFIIKKTGTV